MEDEALKPRGAEMPKDRNLKRPHGLPARAAAHLAAGFHVGPDATTRVLLGSQQNLSVTHTCNHTFFLYFSRNLVLQSNAQTGKQHSQPWRTRRMSASRRWTSMSRRRQNHFPLGYQSVSPPPPPLPCEFAIPVSDQGKKCLDQTLFEKHQGVSAGKYTIGLGLKYMNYCTDREGTFCVTMRPFLGIETTHHPSQAPHKLRRPQS